MNDKYEILVLVTNKQLKSNTFSLKLLLNSFIITNMFTTWKYLHIFYI